MVAIYLFTYHGYKETITEGISEDKEEAWNSCSASNIVVLHSCSWHLLRGGHQFSEKEKLSPDKGTRKECHNFASCNFVNCTTLG